VLTYGAEKFSCEVIPERDRVVVRPRGELDMATVGAVEQELQHLRKSGFASILLDLGGLTFMDSSGLHLVMRWTKDSASDGFAFAVEPGSRAVMRVFELAEMTNGVPFTRPV
jgi:anti-anti-sigma factor